MIVDDVGCKTIGRESSIRELVDEYDPEILFGFDPHPELEEGISHEGIGGTLVVTRRLAAWTSAGSILYVQDGTCSHVDPEPPPEAHGERVRCLDLSGFLETLPATDGLVVKLDVEGAEYPLLEHLVRRGADRRCSLLLVEWHRRGEEEYEKRRRMLLGGLACPVEEWH